MAAVREASLDDPLPMTHSWPLFEQGQRFDLGHLCDDIVGAMAGFYQHPDVLAKHGIGLWDCDLQDSKLTWTAGVFDLFGLPRGAQVERDDVVALYEENSRAAMEKLRAYAIRHRRGFTLDTQIIPATGERRWMRLIAAPICIGRRVLRLHGIKLDVSEAYR